jgi:hypothetical protein
MDSGLSATHECSVVPVAMNSVPSVIDFCRAISRTEEQERIAQEHINSVLYFEEMQAIFGPISLPHRLLTDRENPLESLRPGT